MVTRTFTATQEDLRVLKSLFALSMDTGQWQKVLDTIVDLCQLNSIRVLLFHIDHLDVRLDCVGGEPFFIEGKNVFLRRCVDQLNGGLWQSCSNSGSFGIFHPLTSMPQSNTHGNPFPNQGQQSSICSSLYASSCLFVESGWVCMVMCEGVKEHGPLTRKTLDHLEFFSDPIQYQVRLLMRSDRIQHAARERALLNCFRIPIALFDESGYLVSMNSGFSKCIEKHAHFTINKNLLTIERADLDREFRMRVVKCVSAESRRSSSTDIDILDMTSLNGIKLGMMPIVSEAGERSITFSGGLLYILDSEQVALPTTTQLQQLYKLTYREAEVCLGLLSGEPPKAIALHKNLSVYTVREYLANVFRKTGTTNQIELVNILASLPLSPF